jgi:hypothetical protein
VKIRLHLVEESPGSLALGWQEAAAVLEPARGASGDGANDVQVGEQRLGRGGIRSHGRARGVAGDAQHEQRVGQHQLACSVRAGNIGRIEPADLPGG